MLGEFPASSSASRRGGQGLSPPDGRGPSLLLSAKLARGFFKPARSEPVADSRSIGLLSARRGVFEKAGFEKAYRAQAPGGPLMRLVFSQDVF